MSTGTVGALNCAISPAVLSNSIPLRSCTLPEKLKKALNPFSALGMLVSCVVREMYHSREIEKQMDCGFIASVLINCSDRRVEGCRAGRGSQE